MTKSGVVESHVVGGGPWGRGFGRLWAAYAVSTFGTRLAFDAFPLTAVVVLDAGPERVAALAAAGLAVGAVAAVPLGPRVEFRRKRPVTVAMDLVRCAVLLSVPLAYVFGRLGFGRLGFVQLLVVSVVVAAADIVGSAGRPDRAADRGRAGRRADAGDPAPAAAAGPGTRSGPAGARR
ncbi:hypothetical protein EV562_101569 [Streptomyces sp. BK208]|nr:hypothetical protein EV562_101569 [Streptomyces sp. BK208]